MDDKKAGVYQFSWDGVDGLGNSVDDGVYHIEANYTLQNGETKMTKLGTYPIEAVRFDGGKALLKLGSSYVPLENVKEVY
jgi:flagellar basal-body rod modification protein FlgD